MEKLNWEIVHLLEAGEKIQHISWTPKQYIQASSTGIVDEKGCSYCPTLNLLLHYSMWRIYKEPSGEIKHALLAVYYKFMAQYHHPYSLGLLQDIIKDMGVEL